MYDTSDQKRNHMKQQRHLKKWKTIVLICVGLALQLLQVEARENISCLRNLYHNDTLPTAAENGPFEVSHLTGDEAIQTFSINTEGALSTLEAAVVGRSFNSAIQAGLFEGTTTFRNSGSSAVFLNLEIDRPWKLRQRGTGAGSALELSSVGGGGNKDFLIDTDGQVGIDVTDPRAKLHVNGDVLATDFNQSSSRRWKKNIQTLANGFEITWCLLSMEGIQSVGDWSDCRGGWIHCT